MSDLKNTINDTDHILGPSSAAVTFIEYADYTLPYTKILFNEMKIVEEEIGDSVAYIYRHFPLDENNPHAFNAAKAVEAAGVQGKFWDMHDALLEHQNQFNYDTFLELARELSLDIEKFKEDFDSEEVINKIDNDIQSGRESDVMEVPTLFVNNDLYQGPDQASDLIELINNYLYASDLKDNPIIDTADNKALDYEKDDPLAYSIDPMPLEDRGYSKEEDDTLYKPLEPGMTLDEYEYSALDKVEDQDYSDPEPS